jgi:hypothetical protein
MALFTDGTIASLEDLAAHESAILDMASGEGIDLTAKLGLAQDEIGIELTGSSLRLAPYGTSGLSLGNVAVTAPLKLWHVFHTLELAYRDAYGSQMNERYLRKWNHYKDLSKWASETLFQVGVGIVFNPLPAASAPELGYTAGPQGAATYYARISWVNGSGEEGAPGKLATLDTPSGSLLTAKPVLPPANATGWNVYAGTAIDGLTLQNRTPLGMDQTWVEPSTGLTVGKPPGTGQEPNCVRGLPRILQRG